jgi:uncharacterized protein YjaG (DUF416 family)
MPVDSSVLEFERFVAWRRLQFLFFLLSRYIPAFLCLCMTFRRKVSRKRGDM